MLKKGGGDVRYSIDGWYLKGCIHFAITAIPKSQGFLFMKQASDVLETPLPNQREKGNELI